MSGLGMVLTGARLLGVWGSIKSAAGSALKWVTASTTHILIVALALVGLHDWYGRHQAANAYKVQHSELVRAQSELAHAQSDNRTWQAAFGKMQDAEQILYRAVLKQNAAVTDLHDRGEAAQKAAQGALDAQKGHWASVDARAAAARSEAATGATKDCPSGPAGQALKGDF